ncbi:carboxylating nicotinate-nucleotide diphosphorylase [Kineococcus rhizosphaerae]|uniref:Nicotinate-nucleotide pyrophosphorylase [carboxylating] n=1 Tax=Kineococcus rhizosphaerae TaxID=559628 RepID=A0A2T0R7B3_9ACTN|nr:carboxylating nicotinate-nucleotide diphosphorylase [Kineococcus rhizosphaerae]PRY17055.1 nicotinate-nucleotide pyrophosphorylase [carboxylating] [Kineococcus rhizosphaerae]
MRTAAPAAEVVTLALAEDAPWGDVTSEALLPADAVADAQLVAREPGVLAGTGAAREAFTQTAHLTAGSLELLELAPDGTRFAAGDVLGHVRGTARGVLRAERIALNLLQHLSGVATHTAAFVEAVAGTNARIVDTRKTTPGLRALERAAVRAGGGHNHRWSLSDAVLVKDNHLAVLLAAGLDVTTALKSVRDSVSHTTVIEVEVDRLDQLEAVLAAGVDVVMLDNFSLADLTEGVRVVRERSRALVEASGGVNLSTVRAIAGTGVDLISVGALTQNSRTLDLGLDTTVSA